VLFSESLSEENSVIGVDPHVGKIPSVFDGKQYLSLTTSSQMVKVKKKKNKEVRQDSVLVRVHLSPTTAGKPIQSTCLPARVTAYFTYVGQHLPSEFGQSKNSPFGKIHICTIELLTIEK